MGLIIGKFHKKKTTYEVLEKLENDIKNIEEFRRNTEQTQKKMVGRFVFISICVYLITALIFYFYFFPASVYERILYIIPLLILPILLIIIKRILTWYYNRKLVKNHKKLSILKDEKKKILEDVMDKETYKVAQKILEKFAPDQIRRTTAAIVADGTPVKGLSGPVVPATGLRYRGIGMTTPSVMRPYPPTPINRALPTPSTSQAMSVVMPSSMIRPPTTVANTPLLLPRSILPKDRSFLDKMVDYLVGDGPSNRYALICKKCSSHNGMALKEEFDYLAFRCCYCTTFNPARKQRPTAPKLESSSPVKNKLKQSDLENSSDDDSSSDTDTVPIITESPNHSPQQQQRVENETVQQEDIEEDKSTQSDGITNKSCEEIGEDEEEEEDETKIETVEESIQSPPFINDDSNDEEHENGLLKETTQKD